MVNLNSQPQALSVMLLSGRPPGMHRFSYVTALDWVASRSQSLSGYSTLKFTGNGTCQNTVWRIVSDQGFSDSGSVPFINRYS